MWYRQRTLLCYYIFLQRLLKNEINFNIYFNFEMLESVLKPNWVKNICEEERFWIWSNEKLKLEPKRTEQFDGFWWNFGFSQLVEPSVRSSPLGTRYNRLYPSFGYRNFTFKWKNVRNETFFDVIFLKHNYVSLNILHVSTRQLLSPCVGARIF